MFNACIINGLLLDDLAVNIAQEPGYRTHSKDIRFGKLRKKCTRRWDKCKQKIPPAIAARLASTLFVKILAQLNLLCAVTTV